MDTELRLKGLELLCSHGWVRPPHGVLPPITALEAPGEWSVYEWNPEPADPDASAKPSWQDIEAAASQAEHLARYETFRAAASADATRRICRVYGAASVEEEIFRRLRGDTSEAQDALRDRIRRAYRDLMASDLPSTVPFDPSMLAEF